MGLPFDIITFDCYGTLIDWRAGICTAFGERAKRHGVSCEPDRILALHNEIEPEVQNGSYRPYRDVLTEVARRIMERLGWPLPAERAGFLADSLPRWRPFADTNMALRRLKAKGYRLGILSNVDNDLLARTRRHFTVEFDLLVTAEDVKAYKPSSPHFETARKLIGENRWLHAAQSYFHDIEPAAQHRVSSVWVNRLRERPSGKARPTASVTDLHELADWLNLRPRRPSQPFGATP